MKSIKQLEDRVEQMYQSLDLLRSLAAIIQIVEPHTKPAPTRSEIDPELLRAMGEICSQTPPQDQLDIDRDAIWEMKARAGTQYVLGFLSPKLLTSMEVLFSGIVVQYIQMFNSSRRRAPLRCESVFSDDAEGLAFHLKIGEIRNKHYAHKEATAGRHQLSYCVGANLDIIVDTHGPHGSVEFHLTLCQDLHRNLHKVLSFLTTDIDDRSRSMLSELNDNQRFALRQHWDNTVQQGVAAPVAHGPTRFPRP